MRAVPSKILTREIGRFYYQRAIAEGEGKINGRMERVKEIRVQRGFLLDDLKLMRERAKIQKKPAHNPSGLGDCRRFQVFKHFGFGSATLGTWEDVAKSQRIFSMGDAVHMRFQVLFEMMGILRGREVYFTYNKFGDRGIRGSVDAVVEIKGKWFVVEIKSAGGYAFSKLSKEGPSEAYKKQATVYLHVLRRRASKFGFKKPEASLILYESKGDQTLSEFRIDPEPLDMTALQAEALSLDADIQGKTLPPIPPDYEQTRFPCSYCDARELCYDPKQVKQWLTENEATESDDPLRSSPGKTSKASRKGPRVLSFDV